MAGELPRSPAMPGAAKFGADLVGLGMVELIEDFQGLAPCFAGGAGVARGMVGVAEAGEGVGFEIGVAEVAGQVDGVLVAAGGLLVVGKATVDVAEAVPGAGLTVD